MKSRLLGLVILPVALVSASCTTAVKGPDADTVLTPSPPAVAVAVKELGTGVRQDSIGLEVDGPVSVTFREITIPPGGSTGMHCHHGSIVGVVRKGTLTHYAPVYPDGVHVYRAGDAIEEGPGYAHEGKNLGDEPLVLLATYVVPEGYPLAETDLGRCSR